MTYQDCAYGSQMERRPNGWWIRHSFRSPAFDGAKGDDFGPWRKADKEEGRIISRMLAKGSIQAIETEQGQ